MSITTTPIDRAHQTVSCNAYHAGSRSLYRDGQWYQCAGCGAFHSAAAVDATAKEPYRDGYTGGGGLARVPA